MNLEIKTTSRIYQTKIVNAICTKRTNSEKWVSVESMSEWLKTEIHRSGASTQILVEFEKEVRTGDIQKR